MPEISVENIEQFNSLISSGVSVVKFTAAWCGPCVRMTPEYEKLANQTYAPATNFITIDIDSAQSNKILNSLGQIVRGVPTIHFYKDGELVDEMVGANIDQCVMKLSVLAQPTLANGTLISFLKMYGFYK